MAQQNTIAKESALGTVLPSTHWVRLVTEWHTDARWLNEEATVYHLSSQNMLETHGNTDAGRPIALVSNSSCVEKH